MNDRPDHAVFSVLPDPDFAHGPVVGLAWNEKGSRQVAPHRHDRGQIMSVARGVATIGTHQGVWVVPPQRAIWIPAGTEHWVRYSRTVALRSLYTDAVVSERYPKTCAVLHLDALSRELLNTAVDFPWGRDADHVDMRLVCLLLERMPALQQPALNVPEGKDPRILRIMHGVREAPDDNRTLLEWSKIAGASERTLARLFLHDTGMSFAEWRRQHRLMVALEQLASGEPIAAVAHHLGYETVGNFSTMFRRVLHQSPRDFFRPRQPEV
jgi:AraC family transcriptional regulator, regulator of nimT